MDDSNEISNDKFYIVRMPKREREIMMTTMRLQNCYSGIISGRDKVVSAISRWMHARDITVRLFDTNKMR